MKVYRGISELEKVRGCVVTIGSFDGLHIGHGAIFGALKELSQELHAPSAVITFDPHPRMVVGTPCEEPILITTLEEKVDILSGLGIDNLLIVDFTPDFAALSYAEFVKKYLVDVLGVRGVVMGYNHHFGKGREGSFEILQTLGEQYGFVVLQVGRFSIDDYKISSTNIRHLLSEGDMERVNTLLIEPYSIYGTLHGGVVTGIDTLKILPKEGSYSASVNGTMCRVTIGANRVVSLPEYSDAGHIKIIIKE